MNQPQSSRAEPDRPRPLPQVISGQRMQTAHFRGEVKPFSPQFTNLVQYLGYWWVQDATEWIRLSGPQAEAMMKRLKARSAEIYRGLYAKKTG